ncbi:FIGNL1-interacting regulator of recombination and mitosis-like [Tachypleus tridentatus]|uniref:FIGNL1-interacting regulator of recombination and mitosis-like n=1 Tax=Tachypleus tridentatus TaxID=6853 RepID=UPI003FD03A2F
MSQRKLLDSILQWTSDECREALEDTLPKVITIFTSSSDLYDEHSHVNPLYILCHSFFPCISVSQMEEKFLSKIMPSVCKNFDLLIEIIRALDFEQDALMWKEKVTSVYQRMSHIFNCLVFCIQTVAAEKSVMLGQIYSLPRSVIHIIKQCFCHCKESDSLYKKHIEKIGTSLNALFKEAHGLQTDFLVLLEKLEVCEGAEEDVSALVEICDNLSDVSQVATSLELKVAAAVWKTYTRLATQYHRILQDRLNVAAALQFLGNEVVQSIDLLCSSADPVDGKEFSRIVKISMFNLKVVIALCDKFKGYLGDCLKSLTDLLLKLLRISAASLTKQNFDDSRIEELNRTLVIGVEPLLIPLLTEREFSQTVREIILKCPKDLCLPLCLLLVLILQKLPSFEIEIMNDWLGQSCANPQEGIIHYVFKSLQSCHIEVFLPVHVPGVMHGGRPQRMISLYEHVCTQLCSFIACIPPHYFWIIEQTLLKNLFSDYLIQAMLAGDLWCFVARFGSSELCFSHVCVLANLLQKIKQDSHQSLHLQSLLNRLIVFLTAEHKEKFVTKFPFLLYSNLWGTIHIAKLKDIKTEKIENLFTMNLEVLHNSVDKMTTENYYSLCSALDTLSNLSSSDDIQKDKTKFHKLGREVLHLILCLPLPLVQKSPWVCQLTTRLLHLIANFMPYFSNSELLSLLNQLKLFWEVQKDDLCLAVVKNLHHWTSLYIPPSAEQREILSKLSSLFAITLDSNNFLIKQHALQMFSEFAHKTKHEDVISESLVKAPHLRELLTNFLSSTPYKKNVVVTDPYKILQIESNLKNIYQSVVISKLSSNETNIEHQEDIVIKPPAKRLCSELETEQDVLEQLIISLEENIDRLEKYMSTSTCSMEVRYNERLKYVMRKLEKFQT